MDLVGVASGIQSAKISAAIDMAVAKKSMDNQKAEGAAVVQLIEAASNAGSAPATPGVGEQVDQYA